MEVKEIEIGVFKVVNKLWKSKRFNKVIKINYLYSNSRHKLRILFPMLIKKIKSKNYMLNNKIRRIIQNKVALNLWKI